MLLLRTWFCTWFCTWVCTCHRGLDGFSISDPSCSLWPVQFLGSLRLLFSFWCSECPVCMQSMHACCPAPTPLCPCAHTGPANPEGLRLQSRRIENGLEAVVRIPPKYCAFPVSAPTLQVVRVGLLVAGLGSFKLVGACEPCEVLCLVDVSSCETVCSL